MKCRVLSYCVLFWGMLFFYVFPCQADMSMLTEDAAILRQGEMEIELGFSYFYLEDIPRGSLAIDESADNIVYGEKVEKDHFRIPQVGIRFGLSRFAEFYIYWPAYIIQKDDVTGTQSDFGDVEIYTKLRLVGEKKGFPVTSFYVGTKLPNTSNESGLGTDEMDFFASLLFSKWVGKCTLHFNGGVAILGDPVKTSRQKDVFTYSAAFVYHTLRTNFFVEVNKGLGIVPFETPTVVRAGIVYKTMSLSLDVGVSSAVDGVGEDYGVVGGLTYEFRIFD